MRAYRYLDESFGLKSLHEKRLKISTLDDLNDPFELLPYEMKDRNRRRALHEIRKKIAKNRCEIVEAIGSLTDQVNVNKARAGFTKFEIVKDERGFLDER